MHVLLMILCSTLILKAISLNVSGDAFIRTVWNSKVLSDSLSCEGSIGELAEACLVSLQSDSPHFGTAPVGLIFIDRALRIISTVGIRHPKTLVQPKGF